MKKKPTVLIVSSGMFVGGVASALVSLIKVLERSGYICKVMLPYSYKMKGEFAVVPESYYVGSAYKSPTKNRLLRAILRIFNTLTRWKFYFLFTPKPDHDILIVYQLVGNAHWAYFSDKPKVGWIHGDHEPFPGFFGPLNFRSYRRCLNRFDALVGVSDKMAMSWKEFFGLAKLPQTLLNFVDIERLMGQAAEPLPVRIEHRRKQIVFLGRVSWEKGGFRIVKIACDLLNKGFDFDLWVVGWGFELADAKRHVAEVGLVDNIHFLGEIGNPQPILRACDLLVVPSREEGFGLVIWEGLLQHCAVIATNVGGCAQALNYGRWGRVVSDSDQAIAEAVANYLQVPDAFRPMCGFDSIRSSIENINKENMGRLKVILEETQK